MNQQNLDNCIGESGKKASHGCLIFLEAIDRPEGLEIVNLGDWVILEQEPRLPAFFLVSR